MVCLILTELIDERGTDFGDNVLKAVREILPAYISSDENLTLERLVGMQSGLRDYWILSVLWGATPQDRFSIYQDAPKALQRLGKYHFAPGTQMSYSNSNYVAVGLALEKVTGQTLNDLLEERIFKRKGMKTAALRPDTSRILPPLVGYEGSEETGFIAYTNRIEWAADAGVHASLEDMIAYEKFIHDSATDEKSAYYRNAADPTYIDGTPANYGYGLVHNVVAGNKVVSHSGGLAGFRLRRAFMPQHKLSVIVLLNSETDTKDVAEHVFKRLVAAPSIQQLQISEDKPGDAKIEVKGFGNYFDEEAKLAVVVKQGKPGEVSVNCTGHDEKIRVRNEAEPAHGEMQVRHEQDRLSITRPLDNRSFTARPLATIDVSTDATMFLGKYYSEEIDSTFNVTGSGAMLYGTFDGYLGQGPVHLMQRLGENVWWLACFRSLDAPVPGYWTVTFEGGKDGAAITGVTVSNWGARNIPYSKVE